MPKPPHLRKNFNHKADKLDPKEFKIAGEVKATHHQVIVAAGGAADFAHLGDSDHTSHAVRNALSKEALFESLAGAGFGSVGLEFPSTLDGLVKDAASKANTSKASKGNDNLVLKEFEAKSIEGGYAIYNKGEVSQSDMLQSMGRSVIFSARYGMEVAAVDANPESSMDTSPLMDLFDQGHLDAAKYSGLSDAEAKEALIKDMNALPRSVISGPANKAHDAFFKARTNDEALESNIKALSGKPAFIYGAGHDDVIGRLDGFWGQKKGLVLDFFEDAKSMSEHNKKRDDFEKDEGQSDIVYLIKENVVLITDHGMQKPWIAKALKNQGIEIAMTDKPVDTSVIAHPEHTASKAEIVREPDPALPGVSR